MQPGMTFQDAFEAGTKLPGAWAERSAMLEMAPVGRNGACCRSPERTIHLTKLAIVLRFLS